MSQANFCCFNSYETLTEIAMLNRMSRANRVRKDQRVAQDSKMYWSCSHPSPPRRGTVEPASKALCGFPCSDQCGLHGTNVSRGGANLVEIGTWVFEEASHAKPRTHKWRWHVCESSVHRYPRRTRGRLFPTPFQDTRKGKTLGLLTAGVLSRGR